MLRISCSLAWTAYLLSLRLHQARRWPLGRLSLPAAARPLCSLPLSPLPRACCQPLARAGGCGPTLSAQCGQTIYPKHSRHRQVWYRIEQTSTKTQL